MTKDSKIYLAGHTGVVGLALQSKLKGSGYQHLITRSRQELDLTNQAAVGAFFQKEKPEIVFLAAGQTGGVYANSHYPTKFIYENTMIAANVLNAAFRCGTEKVFYYGCSSMYPRACPQPMKEEAVLSGPLEPTSAPFAVAKIVGTMMCESYNGEFGTAFSTLIPANLYGDGLDYDPLNSIVIPSLIQRFHTAQRQGAEQVKVWGTGKAMRDFLSASDLADATLFLAETYPEAGVFNIGTGIETSIEDLARLIAKVVGYTGTIEFDSQQPEGVDRKLQNLEKIHALGWKPKITLEQGLSQTYKDFLASEHAHRYL